MSQISSLVLLMMMAMMMVMLIMIRIMNAEYIWLTSLIAVRIKISFAVAYEFGGSQ